MRLLFTILLLVPFNGVFAIEHIGNARVSIVESLIFTEINEIDFGLIGSESGICSMAEDGSLSATNGSNCSGSRTPGAFVVSGTSGRSVSISVAPSDSVGGVFFTPVVVGAAVKTLNAGAANVDIIGSLTLNDAIIGVKNLQYTLTTHYQ